MKKTLLTLIAVAAFLVGSAQAGVYYYQPSPSNLLELPHALYATWGINWTHTDEQITDAVLTFHNIWNWNSEPNNLYTHLLDNPALGTTYYLDFATGGDNFANQGYLVGNWTDQLGGRPRGFDLTYRFSSLGLVDALNSYASNGRFGFGFDPDCLYFNSGVTLEITTASSSNAAVPEPTTMLLFGLGLAGAAVVRKFKTA